MAKKLTLNTFKIGAEFKETKMEEILEYLQKNLPEYEYKLFGIIGKGIKVKKSAFRGAAISRVGSFITVKPKIPSLIIDLIDVLDLFALVCECDRVVHNVLVCLKEKYR